jgi:hypothetical protein
MTSAEAAVLGEMDSCNPINEEKIMGGMSFEDALRALKKGNRICREGWNGKDMWLKLQTPDANSKMTLPYIYMRTVQADLVPWLASQTDILSEDWQILVDHHPA